MQRLSEIQNEQTLCLDNVIVPLPDATNPLWQGYWIPADCDHSETLSVFVERILDKLSISRERDPLAPLTVTFINRMGSRKLQNISKLLSYLLAAFPEVIVNVVDFAATQFREQLTLVQQTDILAGVHGAGLTHAMFLKPGSSVVEIIPADCAHKGFRNLAKLRGHQYFSAHATQLAPKETENWQENNVIIEPERFIGLMDVATKSIHNRGELDLDIE